ncbi:MAG: FUSC family protein, partial [Planctomycetota bacterium]
QRIFGSILAVTVALMLVALFSQDRWLFILCMSLWLAFCTYMTGGARNNYFWLCAGFIASIIAMNAVPDPDHAFSLATSRLLETGLGIASYSLVAALLWPARREEPAPAADGVSTFFPDTERLEMALRVFILYWIAFLAVVYIPDFPRGLGFLTLFGALAMIKASTPQLPVTSLYRPVFTAILVSALLYMLLMPRLEGFSQLGLLIFVYATLACYVYHLPQHALDRIFALIIFGALAAISNDQAYTFTQVASVALQFLCILLLLVIADYLPVPTDARHTVLRMLARFQRSADALVGEQPAGSLDWLQRWRAARDRYEMATLPDKISPWLERVKPTLDEAAAAELDSLHGAMVEVRDAFDLASPQAERPATGAALQKFSSTCAMMGLAAWREPRF